MSTNLSLFYTVPLLLLSVLLGVSSSSLLNTWVMLELNMVAFLAFLSLEMKISSSQNMMKYFIVQALGSTLFIWAVFMGGLAMKGFSVVIVWSLVFKMGAFPVHLWYINMLSSMSWGSIYLLSSLQKVLPLFLMAATLHLATHSMYKVILMCSFIVILIFAQTSTKRIVGFSSVFNVSWMMLAVFSPQAFSIFFCFYVVSLLGAISWLYYLSVSSVGEKKGMSSLLSKMGIFMVFASMGGVPPFLGFWAKVTALEAFLSMSVPGLFLYFIFLLLMLLSLVVLVAYLSLIESLMTLEKSYLFSPLGGSSFPFIVSVAVSLPVFVFFVC